MTHLMSSPVKPTFVSIQDLNSYTLHSYSSSESSSSPTTESEMKNEEQEAKISQLNQEIERLSVSNARLKRANRALRIDSDGRVEEKTIELKQVTRRLVEQNIRLQRSNRLLKDDSDILREKLEYLKQEQIRKMTHVGPEYEYLVQMVDVLYRQLLSNKPQYSTLCHDKMMITEKPMTQSHTLEPLRLDDNVNETHKKTMDQLRRKRLEDGNSEEIARDLCYNHPSEGCSLSDLDGPS